MSKFINQLKLKEGVSVADLSQSDFRFIKSFEVVSFCKPGEIKVGGPKVETAVVMFSGTCDIEIDGKGYRDIGGRKDVFSGLPSGAYIPVGSSAMIKSNDCSFAVISGFCEKKTEFAVIKADDVKVMQVGKNNWAREVRMILGQQSPSVNLLVGETHNPPGNWSGTPPHKHEKSGASDESLHEELYYFKTDKPQGFGIERFYSPERGINELIPLSDGSVTCMPFGYHQIVAGPGYWLYYLFALSGEGKKLTGFVDPQHKWINE
jgi:5-deoxy-glucuronate isomerase